MSPLPLTYRQIAAFWLPLAGTWLMMAAEGPYLAAIIARLDRPTENLAAFGVAFAFAIIIEAPVIMLMAASTALVRHAQSYRALQRFTYGLGTALTGIQLVAILPPVFDWISTSLVGLPPDVAQLAHHGLAIMLPWPIAIGYRRFRQGLLIRANLTRRVACGTGLRLAVMTGTAIVAAQIPTLEGVHVGTLALAVGVVVEALASWIMTRHLVARLEAEESSQATQNTPLTSLDILAFYWPLALTSVVTMAIQPMVTFFMGRGRFPLESLAVLPVIHGLTFLFRALGLSYQEVGIARFGTTWQNYRQIRNFGFGLGAAAAGSLMCIVYTPLGAIWFQEIAGLTVDLATFALLPAQILAWIPACSVWMSFQRAILVHARQTRPITYASISEMAVVFGVLWVTTTKLSWVGAVAAASAIVVGRLAGNAYLMGPTARAVQPLASESAIGAEAIESANNGSH